MLCYALFLKTKFHNLVLYLMKQKIQGIDRGCDGASIINTKDIPYHKRIVLKNKIINYNHAQII